MTDRQTDRQMDGQTDRIAIIGKPVEVARIAVTARANAQLLKCIFWFQHMSATVAL